jgi:FixJ family two-component response regulator
MRFTPRDVPQATQGGLHGESTRVCLSEGRDSPRDGEGSVIGVRQTVFVVDDSPGVRQSLSRLLRAAGRSVRLFESAEDFLAEQGAGDRGCLLLDFSLPGLNGLQLQHALIESLNALPIVFLSGIDDIQTGVEAMKNGAVDFLTKPIDCRRLFAAVEEAFRRDDEQRRQGFIRQMIHQNETRTQ